MAKLIGAIFLVLLFLAAAQVSNVPDKDGKPFMARPVNLEIHFEGQPYTGGANFPPAAPRK